MSHHFAPPWPLPRRVSPRHYRPAAPRLVFCRNLLRKCEGAEVDALMFAGGRGLGFLGSATAPIETIIDDARWEGIARVQVRPALRCACCAALCRAVLMRLAVLCCAVRQPAALGSAPASALLRTSVDSTTRAHCFWGRVALAPCASPPAHPHPCLLQTLHSQAQCIRCSQLPSPPPHQLLIHTITVYSQSAVLQERLVAWNILPLDERHQLGRKYDRRVSVSGRAALSFSRPVGVVRACSGWRPQLRRAGLLLGAPPGI